MPSPLPGMNPYFEGPAIVEDFQWNLAVRIRGQLAPLLRPKYVTVLAPRVVYDEFVIEWDQVGKSRPDVYWLKPAGHMGPSVAIAPPPIVGRVVLEDPVKEWRIEIQEVATGELVTAIEILSPVNKKPGRDAHEEYLKKRQALLRSSVHLMEIDLLRSGKRPPLATPLPDKPYFVILSRGNRRPNVEIWPITIQEPIPVVPVPLDYPEADIPLDLSQAIHSTYDELSYDLRIDYTQPPPKPDLSPEDAAWLDAHLLAMGLRVSAKG